MRARGDDSETLAGSLLLAHPVLRDPNFRRAVVLLSVHGGEGAMGVIFNRPTGRTLSDVNGQFALTALAAVPVYTGGPVQPEQLLLCAWQLNADDGKFRLFFGLEPERAESLVGEDGMHVRAFVGYAGWSAGQLEGELKQRTWAVSPIPHNMMEFEQDERMWRGLLGDLNHEWRLLADEPENPGLN